MITGQQHDEARAVGWEKTTKKGGVELRLAPFFIFRTPGSVGTLRPAAGTTPVPLAAITKQDFHPQPLLKTDFKPTK